MPIVADIEDLAPAEFLLMLSLTSKTGKMSSVWQGKKTLLMLREGSIVYAASPSVRERLGSMLVNRGLVTEDQLYAALERQKADSDASLLGSILVDMGSVSREDLREVVKNQFETVLAELLSWAGGVMIFEGTNIPDLGAVHVDPADVLVGIDVDTDRIIRESLIRLNRGRSDGETPAEAAHAYEQADARDAERDEREDPKGALAEGDARAEDPVAAAVQAVDGPADDQRDRAAVRSLMEEITNRSMSLTAEMTLAILGSAGEVAERAVLFLVHPRHLGVVGGFGFDTDGRQPSGNRLRISRAHRSIFTDVIEAGETFHGPVEEIEGNMDLLNELGGECPGEAIAVPLVVGGEVAAVVYGDGGLENAPLGDFHVLEATLAEVATAIEAVQSRD